MATRTLSQPRYQRARRLSEVRKGLTSEVRIEIEPRGYVSWSGTSRKLQAEGVLPAGFAWPENGCAAWRAGVFEYELTRTRPAGMAHREWLAGDRDYWCLRRYRAGASSFCEARVHQAREALSRLEWLATEAATLQLRRLGRAIDDMSYQRFRARLGLPT